MKQIPSCFFYLIHFVLLCGLMVAGIPPAKAQFYSKRSVLWGDSSSGFISSMQVVNDTIYAIGPATDTVYPYKTIAVFSRFDKSGEIISKEKLDIPGQNFIGVNFNNLIGTTDGGFAFGGYCYSDSDNSVLLIKYDRNGQLEWFRTYSDSGMYSSFYITALAQDTFSNYIFTGWHQYRNNNDFDMLIYGVNSVGNLIFKNTYYDPNIIELGNAVCKKGTHTLVVSEAAISTNLSYGLRRKIYELDSVGNTVRYFAGSDTFGPSIRSLMLLPGSGSIAIGSTACEIGNFYLYNGNISRFDSSFNLVWSRQLGPCGGRFTQLFALKYLSDSNFLAVGQWTDPNDPNSSHKYGWLVKFTADGTVLWDKKYLGVFDSDPNNDENNLASVGIFSDNSIIAGGMAWYYPATASAQQAWLLHLDTAGCLPDSNNCGIINGITELITSNLSSLKAYPNPAKDQLTISYYMSMADESGNIVITDLIGREMETQTISIGKDNVSFSVRNWPDGLYHCTVMTSSGLHETLPVSIIH